MDSDFELYCHPLLADTVRSFLQGARALISERTMQASVSSVSPHLSSGRLLAAARNNSSETELLLALHRDQRRTLLQLALPRTTSRIGLDGTMASG